MKALLRSLGSVNAGTLALASIGLALLLYLLGFPLLDEIELKTWDARFKARGVLEPSGAVVLAMVDEKSLDVEGRWPWPRSRLAKLVEILSADGARVIGFDIGFLEPDENSQLAMLELLDRTTAQVGIRSPRLEAFIAQQRGQADHDQALAKAIGQASAPVVLGYFFHMSEADLHGRLSADEIAEQRARIEPAKYPLILERGGEARFPGRAVAYAPESNLRVLSEAADSAGYFNVRPDPDGSVRFMPLAIQAGEEIFPPLAIAMVREAAGRPQLMLELGRFGVERIRLGSLELPTDASGELLINYLGPPHTFEHFSISDILAGEVPPGTFAGRLVLVGASATGTYDMRSTPFSPVYPGAEIQATVIDNILTQRFVTRPDWARLGDLAAIVLLSALAGFALTRLSALSGVAVGGALFLAHVAATFAVFLRYGVWLNLVYPLLGLALTLTAQNVHSYMAEQRERKKVSDAFGRYVAPQVVERMLDDPSRLRLGGEQRTLTVLFSDLAGFTASSERLGPQQMVELLGEYYERMTEQIFAHEGTLKEYVGDELMAIFGAPMEYPDHAQRACAVALAMQQQRHALSDEWEKLGRPRMYARTGVNSGPMLVGNLGSKYRFSYGVLGDNVNLGSRLEGQNKAYGTEILIGENTAALIGSAFALREIDQVLVVGRVQPTRIYELLGHDRAEFPSEQQAAWAAYAVGLEAYRAMRWGEAVARFRETLAHEPGDGPARVMIERCEAYALSAPPEDWDGVFEATKK